MGIYVIIIAILLIEVVVFSNYSNTKIKKNFFIATLLFLAFVAGVRATSVGHDTYNYHVIFQQISHQNWESMVGGDVYPFVEQGFVWLVWIFSRLSTNYTVFLLTVAIFEFAAVGVWLWKNAKNPFLALIIFVCMFYTFFLTGIRQCMAWAILLFAYEDVKKGKLVPFSIKVLIASWFHLSAVAFVMIYLAYHMLKGCGLFYSIAVIATPCLFLTRNSLFPFIVGLIDRYNDYQIMNHGDAVTYTFMLALIATAAVVLLSLVPIGDFAEQKIYSRYVNCILIAVLIMPFVGLNGSIMRVAMYFSIFVCLLMEKIYERFKQYQLRLAVQSITIGLLLFMFFNELVGSSYLYEAVSFATLFST